MRHDSQNFNDLGVSVSDLLGREFQDKHQPRTLKNKDGNMKSAAKAMTYEELTFGRKINRSKTLVRKVAIREQFKSLDRSTKPLKLRSLYFYVGRETYRRYPSECWAALVGLEFAYIVISKLG